MNREKIERWILLRQSGELGRWKTRRLERYLARDPDLQRFETDLRTLSEASRAWSLQSPDTHTAETIHARLTAPVDRRDSFALRPSGRVALWPILVGATALLFLGVGLWSHRIAPAGDQIAVVNEPAAGTVELAWDDGVDQELDALQDLVTGDNNETAQTTTTANYDEEYLIRELLALEGITI